MTRSLRIKIVLGIIAIATALSIVVGTRHTLLAPSRPNFLLILADDQGWAGTSVQMDDRRSDSRSDFYRTPALDRLAAQGMRFSDAYAPSPNCSPSRGSILTGMSPARLGLTDIVGRNSGPMYEGNRLIPPSHIDDMPTELWTIPELLEQVDDRYVTGHYGKWHLGGGGPGAHGFDVHLGEPRGRSAHLGPDDVDYQLIFSITDAAVAFIEQRSDDGLPFYLQVSHNAVHHPFDAREATVDRVLLRTPGKRHTDVMHAAMTEDLDAGVGILLERLDELGLADDTYVIYFSDNGAYQQGGVNNLPLTDGKATVWEGGLRVPLILRGPGIPAGSIDHTPVIGWDLLPTILDLAGYEEPLPEKLDGGSLRGILERRDGGIVERPSDGLIFYFPHYNHDRKATPQSAIRVGDYKLIHFYETGESRLHDLVDDIEEQTDLSDRMTEKTADLKARLDRYLDDVGAVLPTANPAFDPNRDPNPKRRQRTHLTPGTDRGASP